MNTTPPDRSPTLITESSDDFLEAVSLCAALEGMCVPAGARRLLPYMGMARHELTDSGTRLPAHYRAVSVTSVNEGMNRLEALLTRLMGRTDDLFYAVRLFEAREILRESTSE